MNPPHRLLTLRALLPDRLTFLVALPFAIGLALASSGCSAGKDISQAYAAADDFHKKYNDGKYSDIAAATTAATKSGTNQDALITLLTSLRDRFGKHKSSTRGAVSFSAHTSGITTVKFTLNSEFEQGTLAEDFTYHVTKSACELHGYNFKTTGRGPAMASAEAAVTAFHQLFNEGKHKENYAATDPAFKKSSTEEEFVKFMEPIREQFGRHKTSQPKSANVKTDGTTSTVDISLVSDFEHHRREESFTYVVTGATCQLLNYSFRRPAEGPDLERAEAAIAQFHKLLDARKYAEIYATTGDVFRSSSSEADLTALLTRIADQQGRHKSTVRTMSTSDPAGNGDPTANRLEVIMHTEFERHKSKEVFRFLVTPTSCLLEGYHIGPIPK